METERSMEKLTSDDLDKLAEIAKDDREDFFRRHPNRKNTFKCSALGQGAALHFIDGENGIKDFDVWSFFSLEEGAQDFPVRRLQTRDLGESKFGVHPDDKMNGYVGRRIDLLGRSIEFRPDESIPSAIQRYLASGRTPTARALAEKAIVLIEPREFRGSVIWPKEETLK